MINLVYTTYLDKLDKIPNEDIKLIIMRLPPNIDILKYDNIYFIQNLSPSKDILFNFKNDNNWELFKNNFINKLNTSNILNKLISKIIKNLDKHIFLICCEKSPYRCHRSIISDILNSNNIKCEEWKG